MRQKTRIVLIATFSIGMIVVLTCVGWAQPTNPQETLKRYIAELQKDPNDNALGEKIIKIALEMNSPPGQSLGKRLH